MSKDKDSTHNYTMWYILFKKKMSTTVRSKLHLLTGRIWICVNRKIINCLFANVYKVLPYDFRYLWKWNNLNKCALTSALVV